jgi:hypothetical protein
MSECFLLVTPSLSQFFNERLFNMALGACGSMFGKAFERDAVLFYIGSAMGLVPFHFGT